MEIAGKHGSNSEVQMLKILGRKTSGNTQKVLWCCDELGIAYEREDIGREFGKNHEPSTLRLIRTADYQRSWATVWESNTIVRYLCAKHGMDTWYPRELHRLAGMGRWMDWRQTTLRLHFHALSNACKAPPHPATRCCKALKRLWMTLGKFWTRNLQRIPITAGAMKRVT